MSESETTSEFFEPSAGEGSSPSERPRLPRPPLIAPWIPIAAAVAVGVLVLIIVSGLYVGGVTRVSVPKMVGLELGVAKSRAAAERLEVVVAEKRFSALPADTIISQSPAAGTTLRRGDSVSVVISAGTEEFAMPDVIGDGLLLARGVLEGKGLELRVETESSAQPSDTVLATNPSPGVMVRTGSIVRVTIASPGPGNTTLLPLNLRGVAVTIDPGVVPAGQSDVTLEVARRLRSLIEASGGTVLSTRSLTDTGSAAAAPVRARRAQEGSATVAVGLEVDEKGAAGTIALYPLTGPSAIVEPSRTFATQIATTLVSNGMLGLGLHHARRPRAVHHQGPLVTSQAGFTQRARG